LLIVFLFMVVKVKHFAAGCAALQPVVLVIELVHGLATALWACHRFSAPVPAA
jgi:hypothetical protein